MDWRGKPSLETKWLCDPIRSWTLAGGQGKALRGNHRIRFASPTVTLAAARRMDWAGQAQSRESG